MEMSDDAVTKESQYKQAGPERFFTPGKDECFNPSDFTLMFLDSDSVTNVTALNRTNARRILLVALCQSTRLPHEVGST